MASEFAAFAATLEASATANKTTLTQLRALDRFTAQRDLPSGTIDETLAKAWPAGCATRGPNTRRARYYLLRRFCRFLATRHPGTFVPGESLRPRRRPAKPPHIYTRDQVRALLAGALALRDWTSRHPCPIRSTTLHTLIGLLATSGLRISEALHLTLADVDLAEGVLSIRQSKFGKSRLVPVSAATLHRIRAGVPSVLGQPPAVLAFRGRQQPGHVLAGSAPRFHPAERLADPAHHPIEGLLPTGRVDTVYAVARGHRMIICVPHKRGMITRWPSLVTRDTPKITKCGCRTYLQPDSHDQRGPLPFNLCNE